MRRRKWAGLLVVVATLLSGCGYGKIREVYHFPGTRNDEIVNYYRVKVEGEVEGEKVRYISGFFDETALNTYFNTFSQPDNGSLLPAPEQPSGQPQTQPDPNEQRDPDPTGQGRKLVLLLSQNSDAVAEQIGGLAQSQAFATVVSRLVFKDGIAELEQERLDADRMEKLLAMAKSDGAALATRIGGNGAPQGAELQRALLLYVNQVAASLGSERPFSSFDAAITWLEQNRSRLIAGAP